MMSDDEIPFGEFLPDAPTYQNPGLVVCRGVYPVTGGYAAFQDLGTSRGSISTACRGSALYERADGTTINVGGGTDRLWIDVGGTVTETVFGTFTLADGDFWQFERFGTRVLATSQTAGVYELTNINSDTSWSVLTDNPGAYDVIGNVGERAVVGNTTANPYQFQWAALNDPTTWTANATNYNGTGEVDQRYDAITGITGGRFPMLFQKYGISRIDRVGPPTVFRITTIEEARGCIAKNSIATVGFRTFFLAHDGFAMTDGAQSSLIGTDRINKFFLDNVDQDNLDRTHAAIDWNRECVVWAFQTRGSDSFDQLILYSWSQNRWSTIPVDIDYLVETRVNGITLEDLDAIYGDLDSIPISLDDPSLNAGLRRLGAYVPEGYANAYIFDDGSEEHIFDDTSEEYIFTDGGADQISSLRTFNGTTLEGVFETGEFQPSKTNRFEAHRVYPMVEGDATGTTATPIARDPLGGGVTTFPGSRLNAGGYCPVRAEGRFMRVRLQIPSTANWTKAQGIQVSTIPKDGGR